MAPVWFITGVSSGLGTELALKALEADQRVIGTVRSRAKASSQVSTIEHQGGKILELDVTNADACREIFKKAETQYGKIDVLVNNAGYSVLGAVEDFSDEEAKAQMETNFYGPLCLIRAALPGFRARNTGTIVNVSSVAGIKPQPACGLYSASKFALEGLSEVLALEISSYNITALLVEPGAFRTNFFAAFTTPESQAHQSEYPVVEQTLEKFKAASGNQPGDPAKAAARIVEVVTGEGIAGSLKGKVLRLPLGNDCVERYEDKLQSMNKDLEMAREVAGSTGFEA